MVSISFKLLASKVAPDETRSHIRSDIPIYGVSSTEPCILTTEALIFLSFKYFLTVFGYEVAIFLPLNDLIFIFSGHAKDSLHLENPKLRTLSI